MLRLTTFGTAFFHVCASSSRLCALSRATMAGQVRRRCSDLRLLVSERWIALAFPRAKLFFGTRFSFF